MALLTVLSIIGTVYIWVLYTRKYCRCRLCTKEFTVGECKGSGGFGAVYLIKKTLQNGQDLTYILKKLEMDDITELDKV